ncbi:hypothetical protein Igag_0464 [Ignisphaera aggregans DSM 17230]|uniref:Uncharacterized protein n=1 Tax=Ignisphaera aggregans (strain DSM 17230 / JCM 13409 / AQ1.S1) TaxID=583356 RepID=E0SRM7_IGNAA|nr:hypothetical protein Igag_0464 [Ignisphaera aggregans DSM 17230]
MSKPYIKLIVTASDPENIVKCTLIANRVRRYIQRFADVHILITPNIKNVNVIFIEDEDTVPCSDDEETIDILIDRIARYISKRRLFEVEVAAATFKEST